MIFASVEEEKALVAALREGTETGKRACYEQFYRYLTAVCERYISSDDDVKDLIQDIFIKIFTRFDSFVYRGSGSLQAWCYQIAANEALMFLRRRKHRRNIPVDSFESADNSEDYPEDPPIDDIPQGVLLEMIRQLPERYRTVFNLYIFEGKSHREIASILHIKEDSSASNLHRAKVLLAKWIADYQKTKKNGRQVEK